jgi:hypothetical protein
MASEGGDSAGEEINTVTVRLGDLTVTASRICRRQATTSGANSSGLPAAAPPREGKHGVDRPPPRSAQRTSAGHKGQACYYVVYKCDRDPSLIGIHHCQWSALLSRLPGQRLFGSGARDCKKHMTEAEAVEYWHRFCDQAASVFHY